MPLKPFSEVFSERRKIRRVAMSEFERRAKINRSYIHSVEKKDLVPSPEKRDLLLDVMGEIAVEQDADPVKEHQVLMKGWYESSFARLGIFDVELIPVFADLMIVDNERRQDVIDAIGQVIVAHGVQ
jgi:transcriptional regulator with XRE-family HTH domain